MHFRRVFHYILITAALAGTRPAPGETRFFPGGKSNPVEAEALLRTPGIRMLYSHGGLPEKSYALINFGGTFPLLTSRDDDLSFEASGFGAIFSRFILFSDSFDFEHADFSGGLTLTLRGGGHAASLTLYHISSHIGDDAIANRSIPVENNGFEAIRLLTLSRIAGNLRAGGGFQWKVWRRPTEVITGVFSLYALLKWRSPLITLQGNAQWLVREKVFNTGLRADLNLGYLFNTVLLKNKPADDPGRHTISIGYYYGYSRMGFFNNRREHLFYAGPGYTF